MSVVRLLRREGNVLQVADLDILDETPLLDVKPYVPEFDAPHTCQKQAGSTRMGWIEKSQMGDFMRGSTQHGCRNHERQAKRALAS